MTTSSYPEPASQGGPAETDAITLVKIFNVLLRHRRLLFLLPLLFAVSMGTLALIQDQTYLATASFLPQAPERSGSGAAALARQFGINVGGSERPGQSPQFYADLVRGREVLRQAVESEYRFPAKNGVGSGTLIDHYEITDEPGILPPWRKAVERLREDVSVSVGRETGVVQLTVSASHPALVEQIAARLLDLLNKFNLETRQTQALEEGRFVSARLSEAREDLREVEETLKRFLQQNRQFTNSPELLFEHERLQRQVAMRQEIYTSLAQSHEQARIDAVRDTPLITVIASPEGSAEPEGRGAILRAVLGLMLGFMIALLLASVLEFSRRTGAQNRDEYREFNRLKQEAWEDLRHPSRLVSGGRKPAGAIDD